ncbi:hypothetical protein [Nocardioides bizhenqiangii]|uniref:Integral membrane protein n=1 Tax=Nocardioides bizhenqiangii TaxID=3095076 RepID=A0ABZ0ZJN3_9ACTN|nr:MULTISPECIES: hypothetical protein [unclassified Nocardioides]MDZ5620244.1 hypothetical protein [Nocardioides sp. HM23]WQQ24620.1 hypothetical protein SHK19_11630 [Nocardioides sp. HM61]
MSEDPERSEAQIDDVLAGRGGTATDPTVLWLAATARPAAPPALLARIREQMTVTSTAAATLSDRPGRLLSTVAAVLALAFVVHGVGGLATGEWIADNLGEPYAPHPFREGGLALIALGVCAAAAAVSRRWSTVSVLTCTPIAIGFGLHGFTEIGVFAAGFALHAIEGVLGILLALAWWWDRRDASRAPDEDGA